VKTKKEEQLYDYLFTEKEILIICDALDYLHENIGKIDVIARTKLPIKLVDKKGLNELRQQVKMFRFTIFDKFAKRRSELGNDRNRINSR